MRLLVFFTLIVIGINSFAKTISSNEKKSFKYELSKSNIFPWINGTRSGLIRSESGQMALKLKILMESAVGSLDIAIFGVNKQPWFFETISKLKRRGVQIRFVVDQAHGELGEWVPVNFTYPDTARIPDLIGIEAIMVDLSSRGRPRAGSIMHNKFMIVDRKKVWLGSTNLSHTGIGEEYNANCTITINDYRLAEIYEREFEQIFLMRRSSIKKVSHAPSSPLNYSGGEEVSIYFSPKDQALTTAVVNLIDQTQHSIDIAMFYLTHPVVEASLKRAIGRGVKVRLIYDALAAVNRYSIHKTLAMSGAIVKVENWGGKMHMKLAIFDKKNVVIGSMNWSKAGDAKNDENTLIIRNSVKLALELETYFEKLWKTILPTLTPGNLFSPRAEGRHSINSCFDGLDNDYDGLIDQEDTAC